ncbi:MarR family winged helix-turn-helix transcriptional regulator [Holdemania filiformis]|uniref:MarR family winged helix-turn-helix transcriptional regulator n=1 Tax=Holdemania filiformis TaxID=61171 RepID=UPI00242DD121|nr:MarR family transcriptional regulator [Holdemania filiformis]
MKINDLIESSSKTRKGQQGAIFSSLFIIGNKLQTVFDNHISELSLKQYMLLSLMEQSKEKLTFTQLGNLLGCSRQNIKKLSNVLEKKGFVNIEQNPNDSRAFCLCLTEKAKEYLSIDFMKYRDELKYLFEEYSDDEIKVLFELLMRLYNGVESLEKKVCDEKI